MAKIIDVDECSKVLDAYIQSGNINFIIGSGASYPAISLMGNIEQEINALLDANEDAEADFLALHFIQNIEEKNNNTESNNYNVTLGNYVDFLSIVDELLFERKNLLLPRQANIFTTNYDLFIEKASSQIYSLILNDGFDRASSVDTKFRFAPELFLDRTYRSGSIYARQSEVPTVNLFKLHGSVNWHRSKEGITLRTASPMVLNDTEMNSRAKVINSLESRALILPNLNKFGSTLIDRVYYDLLRFFSNSIEKENAILLSFGFSFADEHILDITRRSLRNPTSQLIIFSYDSTSKSELSEKFKSQRNVTIVSPVGDNFIDFKEFNFLLKNVIPTKNNYNE